MNCKRVIGLLGLVGAGLLGGAACGSKDEEKKGPVPGGNTASTVKVHIQCAGDGKEWGSNLEVETVRMCRYSATGKGLTIELGPAKDAKAHANDVMKILLANYHGAGTYEASGPTIPTRIDLSAAREGDGSTDTMAITTWSCDQQCVIEVGPNDLLQAPPNTEVSVPLKIRCPNIGESGSGCKVSCSMKPEPIDLLLRCSGG
ncbi:MAG: hypothetical protein U0414_18065 [Polyangiaceae bacterium]